MRFRQGLFSTMPKDSFATFLIRISINYSIVELKQFNYNMVTYSLHYKFTIYIGSKKNNSLIDFKINKLFWTLYSCLFFEVTVNIEKRNFEYIQ